MKISQKGATYLLVVVIQAALLPIALQIGGNSIGIIQFLLYTSLIAAATCLILSYKEDRLAGFLEIFSGRKTLLIASIAALAGYPITLLLFNIGVIGTNPSVGGIVWRTWVLMLAVMTPIVLRQKMSLKSIVALILSFIAVYVIVSNGLLTSINAATLPYFAALLVSAFAMAISVVAMKGYNISTVGFVAFANIIGAVFALTLIPIFHAPLLVGVPANAWMSILFVGLINSAIASVLFYHVFKIFKTTTVGNALLVVPFLTILLSYAFVGTQIQGSYLIAAAILSVAILLQQSEILAAPERVKGKNHHHNVQMFDVTSAFVNNKSPTISGYVSGSKRALAMRLENQVFDKSTHAGIFEKYNCLGFTHAEPHPEVNGDETEFVGEILGVEKGENVLIGMGEPEMVERAFSDFSSSSPLE